MDRPPEPGDRPPKRLDRPPGERFGTGEASPPSQSPPQSRNPAARAEGRRRYAAGIAAAALGAILIVVLGGAFAVSIGLLVVAAATGWLVAEGWRAGLDAAARRRGRVVPVLLAVTGVTAGQLGLWLFARTEGGALGPLDYLGQTFGWLVPAQFVIAGAAAWWSGR